MSRVGKQPLPIPDGVKIGLEDGVFVAEGPKGRGGGVASGRAGRSR